MDAIFCPIHLLNNEDPAYVIKSLLTNKYAYKKAFKTFGDMELFSKTGADTSIE